MRTTGVTKEVRMPIKSLPSHPSLEHLKYQARDLLEALSQGNAEAIARVREFHPRFARTSDDEIRSSKLSLADAQLIIAREYGFESWPKLKHHVESSMQAAAPTFTTDFKPPAGRVELRIKWPAGACIVKEMGLKQNMEIYSPGEPDPAKQELSLTSQYAYRVVKELPTGMREVDLEHLNFQLEYNSGAYLWRYDSAWKHADGQPSIAEPFKLIMGSKIRYFLNANSQVERVEGVDELVNRLNFRDGAKLKPGSTWDNQALDKVIARITSGVRQPFADPSWLGALFTEEYFKKKFDTSFLPARAVQPGDTWNYSGEWLMQKGGVLGVSIERDCTVTFQSWELRGQRICVRLEFRGTEKSKPQQQSKTGEAIVPAIAGSFYGVVWFDPESGRGIETVLNRDFTVTSKKPRAVAWDPKVAVPLIQPATDHHHQVITEKLVSVGGAV
jgi:hypothetical protein